MIDVKEKRIFLAFNVDKVFKSIFLSEDDPKKELLANLLEEILEKKVTNLKVQTNELNVHHKKERYKRLDLVAEADGKKINVELNTSNDTATKVRNLNYYFSFCSQKARVEEAYDIDSEFLHISLNYNMSKNEPIISCYYLYDPKNENYLDKRYKYFIINLEKLSKCWYDNNNKEVEKRPIRNTAWNQRKRRFEKVCKRIKKPFC